MPKKEVLIWELTAIPTIAVKIIVSTAERE